MGGEARKARSSTVRKSGTRFPGMRPDFDILRLTPIY
jgi:hypothetical protein